MVIKVDHQNPILLGIITFSDSINEDLVGKTSVSGLGECKVEVYSNEGPRPHFHLVKKDGSDATCIQLNIADYFLHGHYNLILNTAQKKHLNEWLKTKYKNTDKSKWEKACELWKTNNPIYAAKITATSQPDYTQLP